MGIIPGVRPIWRIFIALGIAAALTLSAIALGTSLRQSDPPAAPKPKPSRFDEIVAAPLPSETEDDDDVPFDFRTGIVRDPDALCSMDELWPIRNGWASADEQRMTVVQAGGQGGEPSVGAFCFLRDDYGVKGDGGFQVVRVDGTGPLKITRAPHGRGAVQTWSQVRGRLHFTSRSGRTGVFRLRDERIILDR